MSMSSQSFFLGFHEMLENVPSWHAISFDGATHSNVLNRVLHPSNSNSNSDMIYLSRDDISHWPCVANRMQAT